MTEQLRAALVAELDAAESRAEVIAEVRAWLHERSEQRAMPVDHVQWVPLAAVRANKYNPNRVAPPELRLLLRSVTADGFTQPIVVVVDDTGEGSFVVVDGFHRYRVARESEEVRKRTGGMVPVVVIAAGMGGRMASTVRHNRARGKHSTDGMSALVLDMLEQGLGDAEVCNELGMEPEELLRLKHITGFAKLYAGHKYSAEWRRERQLKVRREWSEENGPIPVDV